jgi:DNA-binding NarL/FixJ family response regulator
MRVVVADDVMLTRQGIVHLLTSAGIEVVAEAQDAQGLLHEVRQARPDVALVDIRMPPSHTDEGLVAAQAIRNELPQVGVLVLSEYPRSNATRSPVATLDRGNSLHDRSVAADQVHGPADRVR